MTTAYLGVGSNIDPERNVLRAFRELRKEVTILATSTFYRTRPIGRADQQDYANGVWKVETSRSPHELKDLLLGIESQLGRRRTSDRYAPRRIDLDILLYGSEVIDDGRLTIPSPDVRSRDFVAVPLAQIAPDLKLPGATSTLREIASAIDHHLVPYGKINSRLSEALQKE